MTGRWSCVVLLVALAACRTPQKKVGVYSLDPDEFGTGRYRPAGSDVGETVARRMNLPNYADTETEASRPGVIAPGISNAPLTEVDGPKAGQPRLSNPAVGELPPGSLPSNDDRSTGLQTGSQQPVRIGLDSDAKLVPATANQPQHRLAIDRSKLSEKSVASSEPVHLAPGGRAVPSLITNAMVGFDLRGDHNPVSGAPVSQPIHFSLPAWTNSAPRKSAGLIDWNNSGPAPAFAPQPFSANLSRSAGRASTLAGVSRPDRSVDLPDVGKAPIRVVGTESQPVDLEPLLAGSQDADWRLRQTERQRAEETARQSERDRLAKSLQQLLQPGPK